MSQRLGAERCFMAHPSGAYIMWIIGSGNINTRLEQGWTIHPSERNHLTREQESKEELGSTPCDIDPPKAETETGAQPNSTGKRPRMKR